MAYGLHLSVDQREWREFEYSATNKLTGTIYTDEDKTTAKDLTGYSIQILIYKDNTNASYFSETASIVTAADGTWSYAVNDGEMAPEGFYLIEAQLTKSGDRESTFPEHFYISRSPTS